MERLTQENAQLKQRLADADTIAAARAQSLVEEEQERSRKVHDELYTAKSWAKTAENERFVDREGTQLVCRKFVTPLEECPGQRLGGQD